MAFVDIETTGSNFERDRITEIGIKTLTNTEVIEWESLIDPETFIPQNIQRLTGITPDMVSGQPTFEELALQFKEELEDKIFVAHNARFDSGFIASSLMMEGHHPQPIPMLIDFYLGQVMPLSSFRYVSTLCDLVAFL
ncbi:PolC-type DNA polymerase III [Limnohabitans sp. JirII-31]|uniref:3'-5' exonuclease n=1 Tax=Limnohabitans sp. JirII-31 TaxID=1977908 RepID=UPI001E5D7194|nr:3'-5' exonuclease [Limnohabitans sp. JirII-31]